MSKLSFDHETGHECSPGLLFQKIRELGISLECLLKIESALNEFVNQARDHFNQGKRVNPILIRVFYGKKTCRPGNSTGTTIDIHQEQAQESALVIQPAGKKCYGGWGFFIIERPRDFSIDSNADAPDLIDLFLYREGK